MRNAKPARRVVVLVVALAVAGLVTVISAGASQTTTQNGITRTILAQTAPDNAPRQELYLEEVKSPRRRSSAPTTTTEPRSRTSRQAC
jgi:hypothetical protein